MNWIQWGRRALLIVGLLVGMVIGGYWGAISWMDFNAYKPQITQLIQQKLGMKVQIKGEIEAQAFPLVLQVSQIAAQKPGVSLHISQVSIGFSLWQLFMDRTLAMTTVEVDSPKWEQTLLGGAEAMSVSRRSGFAGWHWRHASQQVSSSMAAPHGEPETSVALPNWHLEELVVRQGEVWIRSAQGQRLHHLKALHLLALEVQLGRPFFFSFDGVSVPVVRAGKKNATKHQVAESALPARQRFHLEGRLRLTQNAQTAHFSELQAVTEVSLPATMQIPPLRTQWHCDQVIWQKSTQRLQWQNLQMAALQGQMLSSGEGHYGRSAKWQGQLQLKQFNFKAWARHMGVPLPQFVRSQALTQLSGQFQWQLTPQSWQIKQLDMQWDESHVQGGIRQAASGLDFQIKIDRLNLEHYLAYAKHDRKIAHTQKNAKMTPPVYLPLAIPVSTLRAWQAQGSLQIGQLQFKGMTLNDVETRLEASQGRVLLAPLDAQLYGGSWQSKLWLDVNGATPAYGWQGRIKQVNLTQWLKETQTPWAVKGTVNSFYRLQSQGSNREAVLGHLNGHLRLELLKGAILGGGLNPQTGGQALTILTTAKAETHFEQWLLDGPVRGGIFQAKNIRLRTPNFQAIGYGRLNLLKETLALNLKAQLVNPPKADYAQAVLPIKVQGSWQKPQWSVPLKPLLESPENQKVILQKLRGLLEHL